MSELPLFPLSGVLLPWGRVPLQIFEQRYLDLVRDSLKTDSPFGVVWIRRGSEVARPGAGAAQLGDYGCCARIVDWDQLPNGLLGVTIQGGQRFDLHSSSIRENGLVVGQVSLRDIPPPVAVEERWQALVDVLQSLEAHPHVQRMALSPDYGNAWEVAYNLAQLLPLEESLKYHLLGLDSIEELMGELDGILNRISGEG
jgi:Lon protease-like protein